MQEDRETRQRSDKLLTTLLAAKLKAQSEASPAETITKPPPGPLRAGTGGFRISVSLTIYVNRWRASEYSWRALMRLPCSTIDPLDLSMSKNKSTQMHCVLYTRHDKISLLNIMSSQAAGIKPLFVSRILRKTVVGTCLPMISPIALLFIKGYCCIQS